MVFRIMFSISQRRMSAALYAFHLTWLYVPLLDALPVGCRSLSAGARRTIDITIVFALGTGGGWLGEKLKELHQARYRRDKPSGNDFHLM